MKLRKITNESIEAQYKKALEDEHTILEPTEANALVAEKDRKEEMKDDFKESEKAAEEVVKATAPEEKSKVKDRAELSRLISEAKQNNQKFRISRCIEEGYRYLFEILEDETYKQPLTESEECKGEECKEEDIEYLDEKFLKETKVYTKPSEKLRKVLLDVGYRYYMWAGQDGDEYSLTLPYSLKHVSSSYTSSRINLCIKIEENTREALEKAGYEVISCNAEDTYSKSESFTCNSLVDDTERNFNLNVSKGWISDISTYVSVKEKDQQIEDDDLNKKIDKAAEEEAKATEGNQALEEQKLEEKSNYDKIMDVLKSFDTEVKEESLDDEEEAETDREEYLDSCLNKLYSEVDRNPDSDIWEDFRLFADFCGEQYNIHDEDEVDTLWDAILEFLADYDRTESDEDDVDDVFESVTYKSSEGDPIADDEFDW